MSRVKEFQAAQACSVIVKMMSARNLDMVPRLSALRDPRFADVRRIALELLREAGHEEDAKTIEAMPLKPLRYLLITFKKVSATELENVEWVREN